MEIKVVPWEIKVVLLMLNLDVVSGFYQFNSKLNRLKFF